MGDLLTSIIRTAVPYVVGVVVTVAANLNVKVDEQSLAAIVTFAIGTVYYIVARALEKKWPQLGWLLGTPKQPVYTAPAS